MTLHRRSFAFVFTTLLARLGSIDGAKYISALGGNLANAAQSEGVGEVVAAASAAQTGLQTQEDSHQQQQEDSGEGVARAGALIAAMNYLQVASPFFARWLHDGITHDSVMELGFDDGHGNRPSFQLIPNQPGLDGSAGVFLRTDLSRGVEPEYYDVFLVGPAAGEDEADHPSPVSVSDLRDVWFQKRGDPERASGQGSIRGASDGSDDAKDGDGDELSESEHEHERRHGWRLWPWHRKKDPEKPQKVKAEVDPVPMVRTPPAEPLGRCVTRVKLSVCEAPVDSGVGAMKGLQACEKEDAPELQSVKICFG